MTPLHGTPDRDWFKSSRSSNNANCVEVRFAGDAVGVRDSKDRTGPTLTFDGNSWTNFIASLAPGLMPA